MQLGSMGKAWRGGANGASLTVAERHPGKAAESEDDDEHDGAEDEELCHVYTCYPSRFLTSLGPKVVSANGGGICNLHSSTTLPTNRLSYPTGKATCPPEIMPRLSGLALHLVSSQLAHERLKYRARYDVRDKWNGAR